jgi:hypothetical protein
LKSISSLISKIQEAGPYDQNIFDADNDRARAGRAGVNAFAQQAAPAYDLLLRGGHVLDDMAIGVPLKQVVAEMTSHPAHEIKHEELGNLSEGSIADVAVLRLETGSFGFTDMLNRRFDGKQKLLCELTIKDGKIVYDLNGMSAELWTAPAGPHDAEAYKWTTFAPSRPHHAAESAAH